MFKVKTYNKIAAIGLNEFPSELYEVSPEIQQPDAILLRSEVLHDMEVPLTLKVIGRAGAGVNNIPVDMLTKLGIPVFNTPGANANAVCELVIAGMLLSSRNICQAWQYVTGLTGDDAALNAEIEKNKKQFKGYELLGKTLGIIGLGSIGVKVANAASHLGMGVIGYDPQMTVSHAWELSSDVDQATSLDELLSHADFISVHVPLVDATKHLINADKLKLMKENAVLLNFSRGPVVDDAAVAEVLKAGKIARYVNDFPSANLQGLPNVISLPHLGASTVEAEENCAFNIAVQVRNFLEYGAISNSANFPRVDATRQWQGVRLAMANANIPNMVTQITAKVAGKGLNILSMTNKSRDQIAYTLLDVEGDVTDDILNEIAAIEGVLHLRRLESRN